MENLAARFGVVGASEVRDRLRLLQQGFVARGNEAALFFPDDPTSASAFGFRPTPMTSPAIVAQALWASYEHLGFSSDDALLILGGNEIVPFAELPNPAAGGTDVDRTVQTDNPYGFSQDRSAQAFRIDAIPEYPVARLPDSSPPDLQAFLALIDSFTSPPAYRNGTFAVVNRAWFDASAKVLGNPTTIQTTPPWSCANPEWKTQQARLLYFNLHGFLDQPDWRGFDDWSGNWVGAVSPIDIVREAVDGAIVFAENCYGGRVTGRSAQDSIAISMLSAGAQVFVGATGIAYGSFSQQPEVPIDADVLGKSFLQHLQSGESAGHSLLRARQTVFNTATSPAWLADQQKTALEFVMYGNPFARL
jgi:hypothetical protein